MRPARSGVVCLWSVVVCNVVACNGKDKSEEATRSQTELTQALLSDFESEELGGIVGELLPYAEEAAAEEAQYEVDAPALSALSDMTFSGAVTQEGLIGVSVARVVGGTLDEYVAPVPEVDQAWGDPDHYVSWERSIVEGDADAFTGGGGLLRTDNRSIRIQSLWEFPYNIRKDYRWVDADGDGADESVAFRFWLYEEGESDDGVVRAIGGFQAEIWTEVDGGVLWFCANWAQVESPISDEEFLRNEAADSIISFMEATEAYSTGG